VKRSLKFCEISNQLFEKFTVIQITKKLDTLLKPLKNYAKKSFVEKVIFLLKLHSFKQYLMK